MIRGRRTVFANMLAKQKGHAVSEDASLEEVERLIDSWIYVGCTDAGHVDPELKCECGRSLRYQHRVKYKPTGELKKFGISHLEMHTGIDAKTAQQIIKGFSVIDFELDEILLKKSEGWLIRDYFPDIPKELELPKDIAQHLLLKLPLLERQERRLRNIIRDWGIGKARSSVVPVPSGFRSLPANGEAKAQIELSFEEERRASVPAMNRLQLSEALQEAVLASVYDGMQSARQICEELIRRHGAVNARLSSGKPEIYPAVCRFLDMFVDSGVCRLVSKDYQDRLYAWENGD